MAITYLLLGSNIAPRKQYLQEACTHIDQAVGTILRRSAVYETAAWGHTEQAAFFNQVLEINTSLAPTDLLTCILKIENVIGRVRKEKWGKRIIDIDILFYDDNVVNLPNLNIPHPYLHKRRFTLVPLAELIPHYTHPKLRKSINRLLQNCPDTLKVFPINILE